MSSFKRGDKVVCEKEGVDINLEKDAIYTVALCFTDASENNAVELDEVRPPYPHLGYRASRFRKAVGSDLEVVERKEELV